MAYQHPLAYLLGVEGLALLRAFGGDYDRDFVEARVAEIRRLLDSPALSAEGVQAAQVDTVEGYRVWSATYDEPGNGLFPGEEAIVYDILEAFPPGTALDAACGTGRHTAYLAAHGHRVIGVDSSLEMLERARRRTPQAEFRHGNLDRLPVPDDHIDVVVCALALTHVPDLKPVIAEFARVLRPGGHLVISDVHHEMITLGSVPRVRSGHNEPRLLPAYHHRASDYLGAALPVGLHVRRCDEPRLSGADTDLPMAEDVCVGPWDDWPWSLMGIVPGANAAASNGTPSIIVWHFQLTDR